MWQVIFILNPMILSIASLIWSSYHPPVTCQIKNRPRVYRYTRDLSSILHMSGATLTQSSSPPSHRSSGALAYRKNFSPDFYVEIFGACLWSLIRRLPHILLLIIILSNRHAPPYRKKNCLDLFLQISNSTHLPPYFIPIIDVHVRPFPGGKKTCIRL